MSAGAHGAVEIDQDNILTVPSGSQITGSSLFLQPSFAVGRFGQMQSVTAGKNGLLSRIEIQAFRTNNSNPALPLLLSLVAGEPGTIGSIDRIGSVAFERGNLPTAAAAQSGTLFSVDVSGFGYRVVAGQKFSILFETKSGDTGPTGPTMIAASWALGYDTPISETDFTSTFLSYDGGFNTLLETNGNRLVSGFDRGFRTYVDVAGVPEPASWALMICGFAAVGITARRRAPTLRLA